MNHHDNELRACFTEVLKEIGLLMSIALEQAGPVSDDHPLAQAGLDNGVETVLDYLDHNEAGLAFEHMLYMIDEPPLVISEGCKRTLAQIAKHLGMPFTG